MNLRNAFAVTCVAVATGSVLALPSPAFAQQGQKPAQNPAKPDAAAIERYKALAADEATRAGDPAYDYQLGIAAADAGRYGEAIIAFQRVLAVQPDHPQARAELARAYALAGDVDTARSQFATVLQDPSLPDPVRQRFTGFVRQMDKRIAGGGSDVSGFFEASAGHDSNINAATDLTSITIPLFAGLGPGTLGAASRATRDQYYDLSGGISGVTAIGRQDRLFGSVLGNWHDNFDSRAFDQASLTGTAGLAHTFANRDVLSLSGQVQGYWLGHKSYRTALGAIVQYTHALEGGKALSVSAQYNRFNYDGDPLRDANRWALGAGYVTRNLSANVLAGHEQTRRKAGDANSNFFADASLGAEVPLAPKLAAVAGVAFDLRHYDAPDPLFLTKRKDERVDASVALKFAILPNLLLQPKATYSRNWSNVPLYDYERWTVQAGIRLEF